MKKASEKGVMPSKEPSTYQKHTDFTHTATTKPEEMQANTILDQIKIRRKHSFTQNLIKSMSKKGKCQEIRYSKSNKNITLYLPTNLRTMKLDTIVYGSWNIWYFLSFAQWNKTKKNWKYIYDAKSWIVSIDLFEQTVSQ